MIDALLERITARFVFVVGKGGVGKTTTAGALALALADRGLTTHLVSTDPAHSLGDLFQQDLSNGEPAPASCTATLILEEFSARAYGDALFTTLREPLAALIERGTYLDEADAGGFLDLSVPGIDEVMACLRLADLRESACARIVVDTAPTGHTIRLLDAAHVIDSWVAAGRAMAEKARVVAAYLVGESVHLSAEPLLAELERKARHFTEDVLAHANVVIVTRRGDVVAAETSRLAAELGSRGLVLAAELNVGGTDQVSRSPAGFSVPLYERPTGCAGLRWWPSHVREAAGTVAAPRLVESPATPRKPAAPWIRALGARLIITAGKGGVGKSTCAAAIAAGLAGEHSVCLVSTDPAGSLSEVLGVAIDVTPVEVAPGLFARQIDGPAEFRRMRDQYRTAVAAVFEAVGLDTSARLDRQVVESLWNFAPPGIDEVVAMVEILEHSAAFDVTVVDSAPTGHFLRLVELPEIVLDWVHALLRLVVKYHAVASLDALARDLLAFAKRLRQLKLDLSTPGNSAVFVVTLAEPMVSAETARLSSALARAGVPVAATIVNRAGEPATAQAATQRRLVAPDLGADIIGPAALRSFLAQWSMNGE